MLVLPLLAITLNIACGILGYKVENITEIQNDLKGIVGKPMNNHQGSFAASQNGDVGSLMDALPRKCKK